MTIDAKLLAIELFNNNLSRIFPKRFLVTGSFANQAWLPKLARPIKDLDLLDTTPFDEEKIKRDLRASVEALANAHGIVWKKESLTQASLFEDSTAPGVRTKIDFVTGGEPQTLEIDIARIDPLTQSPVMALVPSQVHRVQKVLTVPAETAAAWKLHGLFEFIGGQWLPKTLIDLYLFIKSGTLSEREFRIAVLMAFQSRLDPMVCLNRLINDNFGVTKSSKAKWQKEIDPMKESYALDEVLCTVRKFLKPLFSLSHAFAIEQNAELIEHRVRLLHELKSKDADLKLTGLKSRLRTLKKKAYNKIGHLPGSKTGTADRHIHEREAQRLTLECPKKSEVIVQEKLDGSCVAVYRRGREILPLGREGDLTYGSRNKSRRLWADWVKINQALFIDLLSEGERLTGEWLAMVHSTRYDDLRSPFYAFDLFDSNNKALSYDRLTKRLQASGIKTPALLHRGEAISTDAAMALLRTKALPSRDRPEGAIWRLEVDGVPKLIAKYVRDDFEAGRFLEETTGTKSLWNWQVDLDAHRYDENKRLTRLFKKDGKARVIGFDDAPHKRHEDTVVHVNGIVTSPAIFEGMVSGIVDANGLDSTFVLADMILNSKFEAQLHAILIDGITFAFNTVDLAALYRMTNIPVIAVMRQKPNFKKIFGVIDKYCEDAEAYKDIYRRAGEIFAHEQFYFQCYGLSEQQANIVLKQVTVKGNVPEPLRMAHLIGSSIKIGQSSRRA